MFYAPNGTMKTYFAKTVKFLSGQTKDKPCDQLRTELEPNFSLLADNKVMRKESLFVINGDEELDSSKSFSNFLASAKLKDRYDAIS